jgi:hypothetical protein
MSASALAVREDEVLAAGLPHQPRVRPVAVDVRPDLAPQVPEGGGRAGEVDAARSRSASTTSDTARPSPVTMLMTPGGKPRRLEQPHGEVRGELLGRRRLPDHVLPISAGAEGRLPAIAVKLNGVIA